jgi:hypothetical protein
MVKEQERLTSQQVIDLLEFSKSCVIDTSDRIRDTF